MKSDVSKPEKASTKRNNQQDLPDFNTLVKMASDDPEGLEKLRREMAENLINQAPKDTQRKLRGLQFKIDMERRRAKTPMAACIKMSEMMQSSFIELRNALNEVSQLKNKVTPKIVKDKQAPITAPKHQWQPALKCQR